MPRDLTHLCVDILHNRLLQVIQVDRILGRRPRHDVILIIVVSAQCSKLFCIRKLDVNSILLHDPLYVPSPDANDPFMVCLWDMEGYLGWKFLLQKCKASQDRGVRARKINEEIVVVERLKLYFDGC